MPQFEIRRPNEPVLFARSWTAPEPKAVICVIHGLGEHIGRYEGYAKAMNKRGITLMGGDLRGHGRSEGDRGYVGSLEDMLADVDAIVLKAREVAGDLPLFLLGHSMGGGLALRYAMEFPDAGFTGVMASAPMIRPVKPVGTFTRVMVRTISKFAPKFSISPGLDGSKISSLPEEAHRYENDPLNHGKLTGRLAIAMVENGEWLQIHSQKLGQKQGKNFAYPLLIVHSREDQLTDPRASEQFAKAVGGEFIAFENCQHEIHHDIHAPALFDQIGNFVDRSLPKHIS